MRRPRTHAERLVATDGYFDAESMVRRLGNSPVTPLLGGGAAVLLQVAHPLVAAGVVDHSGYDRDLWRRLLRTLRALYLITFGDTEEADLAGAAVQAVHRRVHGELRTRLGRFPAGTPYSACDPELMLWVHTTLVYSSIAAYERFVGALTDRERDRYVEEMNVVAQLFGTPSSILPSSYSAHRDFFLAQLRGDTIGVTPPAREVAAVIMATPLPAPMRLLVPAHRLATARLLPTRLRDEYGLRWTGLHEFALPLAGGTVRFGATPVLRLAARLRQPTAKLAA